MFETAELDHKITKKEWKERVPALREELLEAQVRLRETGLRAAVLFAGVDGAGKGETTNVLNEWMDPHMVVTRAYGKPTKEERERPVLWRYWRDLPDAGQTSILLSAWYSRPLLDRVYDKISQQEFDDQLDEIISFERTASSGGLLIMKFWMHLSKDAQRKRFETLEADPLQKWRVTKKDWKHWKLYDRFIETAEQIISRTSRGGAPWKIVDGSDHRYRSLTVGTFLLEGMKRHVNEAERRRKLQQQAEEERAERVNDGGAAEVQPEELITPSTVLEGLDMSQAFDRDDYREQLHRYQLRFSHLMRTARERKTTTIAVFEGWDAAGKGGAIRRLVAALDARSYQVIPISKPTEEELAHHYLWRFWRKIPRAGQFAIFDRSWYGRVLVERIEGFATEKEWRRAYGEINDFERQLTRHGIVLQKFWIHITPGEQERRFSVRQSISFKRWKLTPEDWRNRRRWDDYELAVHDMVERTSTHIAPWTLVPGNDKRFARIVVLRTMCRRLEASFGTPPGESGDKPSKPAPSGNDS